MAFWVSNTPGQLPKWIFWYFVLLTLISIASAPLVGSPGALAGAPIFLAVMAWKHQIKAICVSHLLGGVLAIIMYLASLGVLSPWMLNGYVPNDFILLAIYCFAVSVFISQYRSKKKEIGNNGVPVITSDSLKRETVTQQKRGLEIEAAAAVSDSSNDDYAIELDLFERGEIDKSLWAKHLVETKGDKEKAKWLYVKERVTTESARRADKERVKAQEEESHRRLAEQKAAEEDHERESQIQRRAAMSRTSTLLQIYEQRKKRALGTFVLVVVSYPGALLFIEAEENFSDFIGDMLLLVASLSFWMFPIFLALALYSKARLKKALRDLGYLS